MAVTHGDLCFMELIPKATLGKTLALWELSLKGTSGIPLPYPT